MRHLGRFLPRSCRGALFPLFSFSFSPFGTERVRAVQHPALIHAWLTAFIMSLIRTQPPEELLGFRVLCCRVPEGTGGGDGAAGEGEAEAIIQACNRKGGHFKSVYFLFFSFNVKAICRSLTQHSSTFVV